MRGKSSMTYVVTESCIKCKYTDCVDVCPVDCFREGPNMLVIDPDECIDCTLCVRTHRVQSMHSSGSITSMFGPSRKQSTGHTSTQSVYLHLMQLSVTTYAISVLVADVAAF